MDDDHNDLLLGEHFVSRGIFTDVQNNQNICYPFDLEWYIDFSDLVKQLMFSWADHQMTNLENGMIQESLSQGCLEESSRDGMLLR